MLTGGLACYRIYDTADGRRLTVGGARAEVLPRGCASSSSARSSRSDSTTPTRRSSPSSSPPSSRHATLEEWLEHFGDEDVCVGPVWTRAEAAADFGTAEEATPVPLGAHTDAWRRELGAHET